jgi:hypothetical protein
MEALSRKDNFSKVVEAYSRPTRIIRGKDISADLEVIKKIQSLLSEGFNLFWSEGFNMHPLGVTVSHRLMKLCLRKVKR